MPAKGMEWKLSAINVSQEKLNTVNSAKRKEINQAYMYDT